jgi:RimJ/RimL family protein N-acetyltransferase
MDKELGRIGLGNWVRALIIKIIGMVNNMKILETKRLILREWKLEDAKDLYEYAKSDRVGPSAGWLPHRSEEDSIAIIKEFIEGQTVYAIEFKANHKVIGGISLDQRRPVEALKALNQREMGFVLNPEYWGQGIVPEAAKRLIKYGFEGLNLEMIWVGHYTDNTKSKRVIEKCGFKYEFKREEVLKALGFKKVIKHYYRITREDYERTLI